LRAEIRRIVVPGKSRQKVRSFLKNNQRKKGWSYSSNSRASV
jgi:hypothetical protein